MTVEREKKAFDELAQDILKSHSCQKTLLKISRNQNEAFLYEGSLHRLNRFASKHGLEFKIAGELIIYDGHSPESAEVNLRKEIFNKGYAGAIEVYRDDNLCEMDMTCYIEGIPVELKKKE